MEMLSTILGQFIGAGMFALIVVFQQEIRKFLLMIGSTNIGRKTGLLKHIKFLQDEAQDTSKTKVEEIIDACEKAKAVFDRPTVIIAHVIPGKGVSFMENLPEWHGKPPNEKEAKKALHDLKILAGKIKSKHE